MPTHWLRCSKVALAYGWLPAYAGLMNSPLNMYWLIMSSCWACTDKAVLARKATGIKNRMLRMVLLRLALPAEVHIVLERQVSVQPEDNEVGAVRQGLALLVLATPLVGVAQLVEDHIAPAVEHRELVLRIGIDPTD